MSVHMSTVNGPWQCYNCQNFGHNASQCKYKSRCVVCGGSHSLNNCQSRSSDNVGDSSLVVCANCKGNHTANYGGCIYVKRAQQVEQLRSREKLSYRDAVAKVAPIRAPGYSKVASSLLQPVSLQVNSPHTSPAALSVATQTEPVSVPNEAPVSLIASIVTVVFQVLEKMNVIPHDDSVVIKCVINQSISDEQRISAFSLPEQVVTSERVLLLGASHSEVSGSSVDTSTTKLASLGVGAHPSSEESLIVGQTFNSHPGRAKTFVSQKKKARSTVKPPAKLHSKK